MITMDEQQPCGEAGSSLARAQGALSACCLRVPLQRRADAFAALSAHSLVMTDLRCLVATEPDSQVGPFMGVTLLVKVRDWE